MWRCLWNLGDRTIYPTDKFHSYIVCLAVGTITAIVLLCSTMLIRWLIERAHRTHWILGVGVEDIVHVLTTVSCLLMWRGGWGLIKDYVLVDDIQDAWLFMGVGLTGALIFSVSSTYAAVGCSVDGEQETFSWPIHYCCYFVKERHNPPLQIQVGLMLSRNVNTCIHFVFHTNWINCLCRMWKKMKSDNDYLIILSLHNYQ